MARRQIETGIEELDRDLRVLFELVDEGKLDSIKPAISDTSLSPAALLKRVPPELVRLAFAVTSPAILQSLTNRCTELGKQLLEEAKVLIQRELEPLARHPAVLAVLEREQPAERRDVENYIRAVDWSTHWSGQPPTLKPYARLELLGQNDRLLLDSMADWDDLAFLARVCMRIMAKQMHQAKSIADVKMLDVSGNEKLGERFADIEKLLEEVKALGPALGIDLAVGAKDKDSGIEAK